MEREGLLEAIFKLGQTGLCAQHIQIIDERLDIVCNQLTFDALTVLLKIHCRNKILPRVPDPCVICMMSICTGRYSVNHTNVRNYT